MPQGARDLFGPQPGATPQPGPNPRTDRVKAGAFLSGSFGNAAGTRPYRLYVPSRLAAQPVPLIVMLHGCMQSPEDFAAGTGMNEAAEARTCLVLYPGQTAAAHKQRCWRWFSAHDQRRDLGEPSIIAGITRQVMREYAVDPARVYVAGLSAGGAAAAIMGQAYPDLYAAIGVHSGLACGAACDPASALHAMQHGNAAITRNRRAASPGSRMLPAIVFHGDRDTVVSPRNADDVVAQLKQGRAFGMRDASGRSPDGTAFRRVLSLDASGTPVIEQWTIQGGGHAWSGGRQAGSFTDARGPDATREMLRFFAGHPHPSPGVA